jgi:hypothetical protein
MSKKLMSLAVLVVVLAVSMASSALALGTPRWQISTLAVPSAFPPYKGLVGFYEQSGMGWVSLVSNAGGAPTNGGPVTLTETLPPHVTGYLEGEYLDGGEYWYCQGLTCVAPPLVHPVIGPMQELPAVRLWATVGGGIPAGTKVPTTVTVSGGGAPVSSVTRMTEVNTDTAPPFGVADLSNFLTGLNGEPDTQAADHPNGLFTGFDLNTAFYAEGSTGGAIEPQAEPVQGWKDIVVDLPPGMVANPQVAPQCSFADLLLNPEGASRALTPPASDCPPASQVGVLDLGLHGAFGSFNTDLKIYNMTPERDEPAEFAFNVSGYPSAIYPTVVGQGASAHIRVTTPGIPYSALLHVMAVFTKFFGDPNEQTGGVGHVPNAFFTNSSDCEGGPLVTTLHVDSYQDPGRWTAGSTGTEGTPNFTDGVPDFNEAAEGVSEPAWKEKTFSSPPVTGCEKLHFDPSLALQPETTQADEPTGLAVDLKIPQNPDPHGLATPPFKNVTLTLPAGMSLSPSAADGLQACTAEEFDLESNTLSSCPNASVLGTAKVTTPLLAEPLTGYVFLAEPGCDPCSDQDASDGNMFKLYLQLEGSGIVQKLPGTIYVNTTTGQLTTKFLENPQFPVSEVQLTFKGGLRAGLATPQSCGTFTATSDMTPWSTPYTPDATPSSSFDVSWDGGGGACPSSPPLTPSFSAGTSNPNAGQFSPFTLTLAREDRQQDLSGIQVKMPPGLLGSLTGVPLCGEEQANAGTCSAASRIGTMTVAAGPGGHPFYTQGSIYLTEHYDGAPFGLSIVVPTKAGPFNLGNVVVRSRINIDENTAALTVTSNPFPQILDGIPLRLRTANVTIERPGFIFNPTNCAQQHIEASISGAQGATTNVSAPFAVSGCAGLHFGPKFTVSTSGKTSRANGASLDARVVFPSGAQSNIAYVKVELPKRLPSRLTTLQKACTAAQFEANPSGCPAASVIGVARVSTPILPVELTGPVYFVSHGGEAFPSLVVVLQGDGVRVDLTASTFISKQGITSSTFKSIPDVPVNSFELYLPEGPDSALAANGNLCDASLLMPTLFTAQDGAQLKQNTKIAVTGCPKATKAAAKRAPKASRARKSSHGQGRQS